MAKTFDELVKRTTSKKTRQRAAARTRELLGELLLSEIRKLGGKSQREVASRKAGVPVSGDASGGVPSAENSGGEASTR